MIKLVVRNRPFKGKPLGGYHPPAVIFRGKLLPNPPWVASDCVTLSTGDNFFPIRIIKKSDIVGNPTSLKQPKVKTYRIKSSKGDQFYTVRNNGQYWSCTCAGYLFRQACRHINQVKDRAASR